MSSTQLLVFGFAPGAEFEGRLVGALERIESGGTLRIVDLLFVFRDAGTGEIEAVDLKGSGAGGLVAPLIAFRLDVAERRRATRRALGPSRQAATLRELGERLEPGAAIAAVLIEHVWAAALADAVARTGGTRLVDDTVDVRRLGELEPGVLAAAAERVGTAGPP